MHIEALLFQCRHVGEPSGPLHRRHTEQAQLPAFDKRHDFAKVLGGHMYMAAEHGSCGIGAAFEGNRIEFRAGELLQAENELMGGAARKSDGYVDRFWLRLRRSHQVLDRAKRGIVEHRQRVQIEPDHAQRLKLVEADVKPGAQRHRDEPCARQQYDVRIASLGRGISLPDGAASARAILDEDRLRQQLLFRDDVRHHARNEIRAASGTGR